MPGRDSLEHAQRRLYQSIQNELSLLERGQRREIADYERSFLRSLPRRFRAAPKSALLQRVRRSSVVLVGDFHPFSQSQKGFLRLLRDATAENTSLTIALECFQQSSQPAIDEYLRSALSLAELREESRFDEHWPFSWESYRDVLVFARENGARVIALNVPEIKRNNRSLRARDEAAAARIAQELAEHPDRKVCALYGELHLAPQHLPGALRRRMGGSVEIAIVHQNIPQLFWRTPRGRSGQRAEVLRWGSSDFCVLNSVPWVKLRSYLDWLEGNPTGEDPEDGIDVAGTVHHYAHLLAESLGLPTELPEDLELLSLAQAGAATPTSVDRAERTRLRHSLAFQRTGFLPRSGLVLLHSHSSNAMAEAAAFLLWHARNPYRVRSLHSSEDHLLLFALTYLGSKLLNPKRKCNEVQDIRRLLRSLSPRMPKHQPKRRVLGEALRLLAPILRLSGVPARSPRLSPPQKIEACRLAGFILGDRAFLALLKRPAALTDLRTLLEDTRPSPLALAGLRALVVRSGIDPLSKKEKF